MRKEKRTSLWDEILVPSLSHIQQNPLQIESWWGFERSEGTRWKIEQIQMAEKRE